MIDHKDQDNSHIIYSNILCEVSCKASKISPAKLQCNKIVFWLSPSTHKDPQICMPYAHTQYKHTVDLGPSHAPCHLPPWYTDTQGFSKKSPQAMMKETVRSIGHSRSQLNESHQLSLGLSRQSFFN